MRRVAAVLGAIAVVTVAARVAAPPSSNHVHLSAALACGIERWKIKTLQDRPRLYRAHGISVAQLTSHDRPLPLPPTRAPFERRVFSVGAAVTLVRREADGDLHLVLEDGLDHMIAESPSFLCTRGATAYRRRQMRDARAKVRLCDSARIVGVAFFDFQHYQTGVAPNAIELHPILDFACSRVEVAGVRPP